MNRIKIIRSEVKLNKRGKDNQVLGYISGKIFNGNNVIENIINYISVTYCKLTGIHVLENKKLT